MKVIDRLKFKIGQWALKGLSRGFSEISAVGRQQSDWIMSGITDDADLQSNWFLLVQYSRDLFKMNPYMRKFRVDLIANVFGACGIILQMKIKEEIDRVVYAAEEKAWLEAKERSWKSWQARAKAIQKRKPSFDSMFCRDREFFARENVGQNGSTRAKAVVKAGQPDAYANNLIERAYKRWQLKQNCTVGQRHSYAQTRHQRLIMCARDGDVFIRLLRWTKGDKTAPIVDSDFGFAIQLISSEWVDHGINQLLDNGNYVKMGIEYDKWGAAVAYYVVKRQPNDWRHYSMAGSRGGIDKCERVESRDMIHYCQFEDSESGRGAPWIASIMSKLRHLDKYSEAEVISARAEACKGGHYEATVPGVAPEDLADYMEKIGENGKRLTDSVEPAMWKALPYGYTANAHDPKHPSGNFPAFKKEMIREVCAGAGDQYNIMAGDLEGVNYSSMRAGALDIRELWMLTQEFDIETAEIPIFSAFLEMALANGAIPLPLTKLAKYNHPQFQGRRWPWVDPLKDAKADQQAIDSLLDSRTRICNENGKDFEEIIEEQAIEKILIEEAGLLVTNAAENDAPPEVQATNEVPSATEELKARMDTYGVGVRAGALTPQQDDEEAFRKEAELPAMSEDAKSAWEEDNGVRRPITLASSNGEHPSGGVQPLPDDEDNPPSKPKKKSRPRAGARA